MMTLAFAGIFPDATLLWMMAALGVCFLMLCVRIALGPERLDRLAALEALTLVLLCFMALWAVKLQTLWFFDAIVVLALVGFLSTVAIAKYDEEGRLTDD